MIKVICLMLCCACLIAQEQKPEQEKVTSKTVEMTKQEKAFQTLLNGAKLEGSFTMKGKHTLDGVAEESYEISSLEKMPNGLWRFMVRIKYMNTDVTVPLFLDVKWAGDTPMIYVEKIPVPGVGTYSARVLFNEGRYAGTWSGVGYGGHLFGEVKPMAKSTDKKEANEQPEEGKTTEE